MKNFIIIALLAIGFSSKAQITFEHDYDSASTLPHGTHNLDDQLIVVKFEISGDRYVKINRHGKYIAIYDMNHSLIKKIDCSSLPLEYGFLMGSVIYISEQLFNMDSKIEFLYGFEDATSSPITYFTGVYNEDGVLLFSDTTGVPIVDVNTPQQQLPIYNTSNGTKMILSYPNGHAKVFNLPGTLSEGIANANNNLIAMQSKDYLSNPYPNPTTNSTKIDYTLPDSVNEGDIVFYNLQGMEVKRFKVDKTFSTLLVSTADIAAGTYLYQLQTSAVSTEGKKMVVIK